MEVIMINTILDIIRLLNDGNIVPMQKDEDTKIDLYNEKVQLFMDASGEENMRMRLLLNTMSLDL